MFNRLIFGVAGLMSVAAAYGIASSSKRPARKHGAARDGAPVLEATTQKLIDALAAAGGPPLYTLSPQEARTVLDEQQASADVRLAPADEEDTTIPGGPGGAVSVRIVRPKGATEKLPVILYFHGGGWILGNKNTHDRLVRELANGAHAAVVFVNYTPSPEAHFPVPLEEAYAATAYVAENGARFNVDGSRLAVVGDSAGGNMAAVVTLMAKQRGGPKIAHQVLLYPVTDAGMDTASYRQFQDGPWLTKATMEWFWDAYAPDPASRSLPAASPLRASLDQLAGLPPALIVTGENDVLRDEGEAYARKLTLAGVPVNSLRINGTIHAFAMLNALANTPATRDAIALASAELRSAFSA
jgi:acetyl esterase